VGLGGEGESPNRFAPNPENKKDALGRLFYVIFGNVSLKVRSLDVVAN